jgi:uncharacterized tellurite resistance protein B-like protein
VGVESLDEQEQLSLVVLLKAIVTADGTVSPEEGVELSMVARQLDPQVFQRADAILFNGREGLRSFLRTVTRQDARDIIYDTMLHVAKADGIDLDEAAILDDVVEAWDIVVLENHRSEE